jgi:acetoin:2,6-dichlorophenolindophenol oxidoreductase subunit alpha
MMMSTTDATVGTDAASRYRNLYELMAVISATDRRASDEARSGSLKAAFYPVRGLEAVCGAIGLCLADRDYLVSTYRNLGDAIAKGVPLADIIAEYYGRVSGTSKGQGGPMHLVDAAHGLMATSGIVGGGIPIASGLGLAAQLDGDGQVVVATFGDGATSIGAFHEGLNLAALWNLPVLFVCQNNQWGEHTALRDYSPVATMAQRAEAFGMRSVTVDGFDAVQTLAAVERAVTDARTGSGPTLLEFVTYRLTPHVATADMSYVPDDELDAAMRRDPVPSFRAWLLDQHLVSASDLDGIDQRAATDVDHAFGTAATAAAPDPAGLFDDVFADPTMVPGR